MADRISSFAAFFPYYLGEHRSPACRALHFVGTSLFLAAFGAAVALDPVGFGPAMAIVVVLLVVGAFARSRWLSTALLLAVIAVVVATQPLVLLGVVCAYGFAWVAHFKVEHNRPATFTYPLWSLLGDFRMWGMMATGQLWKGDPIETLGLQDRLPTGV